MPGVSIYRMKSIRGTIDFLTGLDQHRGLIGQTLVQAKANKENLLRLSSFLLGLDGEYFQRIERNQIDFYTNDKKLHAQFENVFADCLRLSFVPRDTLLNELDTNKYIICKKLPHKKYKFKAFLLPHKIKSVDEKHQFVDWLVQNNKVLISESTVKWFIQTEWYWDRRYIYVEDSQSMLLVQMRCSNALGRIYEYLVSDK
jgi:hypothetical protein